MQRCLDEFVRCLGRAASHWHRHWTPQRTPSRMQSTLYLILQLPRWKFTWHAFLRFWTSWNLARQCQSSFLSPFWQTTFFATQRSSTQDRAVRRASPSTAVKSLRWFSKHAECQELAQLLQVPVVASYAKSTACKDRREAYPLPLSLVVAFGRGVCNASTPDSIALFMGAVLLCCHASLRFGDAQRMPWQSIQVSTSGMHLLCHSKTTKAGQQFACTWHGLSGKDADSSCVLHWLGRIASLLHGHSQQLARMPCMQGPPKTARQRQFRLGPKHMPPQEEEMQPVPCTADFSNDEAEALQFATALGRHCTSLLKPPSKHF